MRSDTKSARSPRRPRGTTRADQANRKERIARSFVALWEMLFTTPVHLDSALSKQNKDLKSTLAQIIPSILLRPASQAQALGVGVTEGEPWSLAAPKLSHWRPAALMAERLYELMSSAPNLPEAIAEDFPAAMVEAWRSEWGAETTARLIATLAQEPPLSLRARRSVGAAALVAKLKAGSSIPVRIEPSGIAPLGARLGGYAPVLGTDLFREGAFEIQDEGSQLMALFALWPEVYATMLADRPGAAPPKGAPIAVPPPGVGASAPTIIDACAGAGGKTLAIADLLKGRGRVYAYDTAAAKLQALRRRATHAGLTNIQTLALSRDAEEEAIARFAESADVVLVDAPCTGWGVLRRNPDIKWRQTAETLTRMPELQKRVLSLYSRLVAPGGRLVYGVCTFRKSETLAISRDFVETHPEFTAGPGGFLGPGSCDGFFMQSFTKGRASPPGR